ncbi:MAG: hypothetical protein MUD10_05145 [Candidatus Pacebacteria bacterium]|nr:hypothetical protein [Candidatus Paceibacterota bacterium]
MTLKLRLSLIVSGMVVFFALVAVLIYVTGTKSAGTGDGANVEKTAPSAGEAAKLKVKQTEADKYDAEVKKDMAVMYGAQKKYLELKGRYFQCGPFKGDDNCDGFDDNYPFDTMTPVLDNVPFSEMDKIYGIEQRDQWEYKGIDNTNDPRQFCYYAKLMNGGYYTASPKGNFERPERPWSFEECASSQIIASPEKTAIWRAETTKRDNERIADMGDAIRIQKECYANMGHYCQIDGYPGGTETVNIGKGWRQFLTDPLDEGQCGTGYLYCGLSNLDEPQDFCYYAKLEKGGFYVVSPAGGLKRDSAPESFRECREGILKGIKLLKPNGGEVWETGKTHRIEWQASAIDNVWLTVIYEPGNGGKAVENYIAPDFKGAPGATGDQRCARPERQNNGRPRQNIPGEIR